MTGILPVVLQVEAVVEGQFLSHLDIAAGDEPNPAGIEFGIAVGPATMINESRGIPGDIAIQVIVVIKAEDIFIGGFAAAEGFCLVDLLADVLDDAAVLRNIPPGKSAQTVDR